MRSEPLAAEPSDAAQPDRGGVWAIVYAALWLNLSALALLVLWPRYGIRGIFWYAAWVSVLGVLAWFLTDARVLLHDLLISLSPREKLLLGLGTLVPLFAPLPARNLH